MVLRAVRVFLGKVPLYGGFLLRINLAILVHIIFFHELGAAFCVSIRFLLAGSRLRGSGTLLRLRGRFLSHQRQRRCQRYE